MSQAFHLSDILSITTGRLVSTRHMDGVYDILNYLTGDNLWTHQLPRAGEECRPWLLRQHPQLAAVQVPDFKLAHSPARPGEKEALGEAIDRWLAEQYNRFGTWLTVDPIPPDAHLVKDALAEAQELAPGRVVPIVLDEP